VTVVIVVPAVSVVPFVTVVVGRVARPPITAGRMGDGGRGRP
jgi:hypothetical protein